MNWRLLGPLTPEDRQRVLDATRLRRYARGEIVCHEDDPGDSLHLVRSGRLGVRVSTPGGEMVTLSVLTPGSTFGELALVGEQHRRTATVVAWEPTETLTLTSAAFEALCKERPSVERMLVTLLADRVDTLSKRLLEALYVGLDRRVYLRLVELSEIYDEGQSPVVIPISQDDLAGLVGASRPSVNQVLQRLSEGQVVELGRRRITIVDPDTLRRRAGG